jgi:hypothetical protein
LEPLKPLRQAQASIEGVDYVLTQRPSLGRESTPGDSGRGLVVEANVRDIIAAGSLPDFVFHPRNVRSGARNREISDGIIAVGTKCAVLQTKTRSASKADSGEAAEAWLRKQAVSAARQTAGSIRMLRQNRLTDLRSLRGRYWVFDASAMTFVAGVVVLDHPSPPTGMTIGHEKAHGVTVIHLLKSDWDYLAAQLASATELLQYLTYLATASPVALGDQIDRYLRLAVRRRSGAVVEEPRPSPLGDGVFRPHYGPPLRFDDRDTEAETRYARSLRAVADLAVSGDVDSWEWMRALAAMDRVSPTQRGAVQLYFEEHWSEVKANPEHIACSAILLPGVGQILLVAVGQSFEVGAAEFWHVDLYVRWNHWRVCELHNLVDVPYTVACIYSLADDAYRVITVHGEGLPDKLERAMAVRLFGE